MYILGDIFWLLRWIFEPLISSESPLFVFYFLKLLLKFLLPVLRNHPWHKNQKNVTILWKKFQYFRNKMSFFSAVQKFQTSWDGQGKRWDILLRENVNFGAEILIPGEKCRHFIPGKKFRGKNVDIFSPRIENSIPRNGEIVFLEKRARHHLNKGLTCYLFSYFFSLFLFAASWPFSLPRTNSKFAGISPRGKLDFLGGIRDVPEFLPVRSEFLVWRNCISPQPIRGNKVFSRGESRKKS